MSTNQDFTNALTARLRQSFSTDQIDEYAAALAELDQLGLKIDDVFPDGMPSPGMLVVKTLVPIAALAEAIGKLQDRPHSRRIEIFPNGIPTQDMWRVRIGMGLK